ncbi:hypothetical protein [Nocardia tengchongensis]|uniref:hypothetical protein n=1 Tax=Nocardia tengchongensis TaxID=2055889 RepID=UPI0036491FF1
MTVARRGDQAAADRYVESIAARMNARVTQLSAAIRAALEEDITALRGDTRTAELLGASVEANVDTLLHALRHDIPVESIQSPAAAVSTPDALPSKVFRPTPWYAPTGWGSVA